ncbi:MAG: hypothetical protein M1833_005175 [Piccolia ochrophora]|nr:MAG: hypothetical protein M1833_005175 [Piccolia ochrophora]
MVATRHSTPSAVSKTTFTISGILTTVYGLDELAPSVTDVACLWLLHPRLKTHSSMEQVAAPVIERWNAQSSQDKKPLGRAASGLIAVSFDQRNHGTREVSAQANEAWRGGNPTHAQDMFSVYHGTAKDTSILLDYLAAYVFPLSERTITTNLALGISLGGHAVWQLLVHEARITTGVVIIGCPNFTRLMLDRAAKSKLQTWTSSQPPGASFIGSSDLPDTLVKVIEEQDPAAILFRSAEAAARADPTQFPLDEIEPILPLLAKYLGGKRILNLAGRDDKLVPYDCSKTFLQLLNASVERKRGSSSDGDILITDKVYEGVGHSMSAAMLEDAIEFLCVALRQNDGGALRASSTQGSERSHDRRGSRM